jgi:hypothetical protein
VHGRRWFTVDKRHPPSRFDDVAEWPQIPGLPGDVQRLVQLLLEPRAVGVGQVRSPV